MSQKEMAGYLKLITAGIGVLFLLFVLWFLPSALWQILPDLLGKTFFYGVCGFIWVTAVPCLVCLGLFWGICVRIGEDRSFSGENARALKRMSHWMMADSVLYGGFLILFVPDGLVPEDRNHDFRGGTDSVSVYCADCRLCGAVSSGAQGQ